MRASIASRCEFLSRFSVAIPLLLGLGFAAPAQARGLVADTSPPTDIAAPCNLGDTACRLNDLTSETTAAIGDFDSVYIYSDGVVSFYNPLPIGATLGNLGSLGSNFVAPGFADYSGLDGKVSYKLEPGQLAIYWSFEFTAPDSGDPADAIFGLFISSNGDGTYGLIANYGITVDGIDWYQPLKPYCDKTCDPTATTTTSDTDTQIQAAYDSFTGDGVAGVYLPSDVLTGSSYAGGPAGGTGFDYGFYAFTVSDQGSTGTTSVPEPDTWLIMAFGLGALGVVMRRSQQRALAAAV